MCMHDRACACAIQVLSGNIHIHACHLKVSFQIFDSSKKRGGAAKMEKDVLVAFEDRVEIVKGVKWNTTAETFIKRYINVVAVLNLAACRS